MGDLFGGGGGGGEQEVIDAAPEEFAGLRQPLADALRRFLTSNPSLSTPAYDPATGTVPQAGMTGNENTLLNQIFQTATQGTPLTTAGNANLQSTIQGNYLSPQSNPFLQASIDAAQKAAVDTYQQVALPQQRVQFTRAGQMVQPGGSSPFERAAALGAGNLARDVGNIATQISAGNYESERGRQFEAQEQGRADLANQLNSTIATLQASALPRLIQQNGIDQGLAQYNQMLAQFLQSLGIAGGVSGSQPVVLGGTSGGDDGGSFLGGIGDLLGGIGGIKWW